MEQMGSSYLLAHGLGVPVKDAVTTAKFPAAGTYRFWVRTKDWVAPWKAPGGAWEIPGARGWKATRRDLRHQGNGLAMARWRFDRSRCGSEDRVA